MENLNPGWTAGVVAIGIAIGYLLRRWIVAYRHSSLEHKLDAKLEEAKAQAQKTILEAQNKAAGILADVQQEERRRKKDIERLEERLLNKEDSLSEDKKAIEKESNRAKEERARLNDLENEIKGLRVKAVEELEKVANFTKEEAKTKIFEEFKETHRQELAQEIARLERDKKDQVEAKAIDIITSAIHR